MIIWVTNPGTPSDFRPTRPAGRRLRYRQTHERDPETFLACQCDSRCSYSPDSRLEKIIGGLAFMHHSLAVNQLETDDRLADKTPVPIPPTCPVYVRGQNPGDALRVMRRQRLEGEAIVQ